MQMNHEKSRILIIDDTPGIHNDFKEVLGCGAEATPAVDLSDIESQLFGAAADAPAATSEYRVDSAFQGEAGVELVKRAMAESQPYALAFVDMRMPPGWDGVRTIKELWKVDPALQVVICTAYSDYSPEQITKELKLDGRMLILRKPFDTTEVRQLARTMCDKWRTAHHQAELERLVESRTVELKRAALHDALTDLPNRLLFSDRLTQALQRSKRDPSSKFAVLFIDVNEFKQVNDSLGHEAGDELLTQITQRLSHCIREIDTVARVSTVGRENSGAMAARLGGDEFAILLEGIKTDADAARVAQRMLDATSEPYVIDGHDVRNSLSIGITTSLTNYEKADDMLRDADTAMYHAKRQRRAGFLIFDQKMHVEAMARLNAEAELRAAIENGGIEVHYQPIVELDSGRISGFEALARWRHPTRGLIQPSDFIPLAEETGLVSPLGQVVLKAACEQLVKWHALSPDTRQLTMSVNLSCKQLLHADLAQRIKTILRETGVSPRHLKLEITESTLMTDARASLNMLEEIQKLDVQLQIDDFGTGYSSLSCLQSLPLNGLKVDRGFVQEITSKGTQAAVLRTIINLAKDLNLPVVSEGVETAEQAALLKSLGCEFVQGYLYSKPLDAAAASTLLANRIASPIAA